MPPILTILPINMGFMRLVSTSQTLTSYWLVLEKHAELDHDTLMPEIQNLNRINTFFHLLPNLLLDGQNAQELDPNNLLANHTRNPLPKIPITSVRRLLWAHPEKAVEDTIDRPEFEDIRPYKRQKVRVENNDQGEIRGGEGESKDEVSGAFYGGNEAKAGVNKGYTHGHAEFGAGEVDIMAEEDSGYEGSDENWLVQDANGDWHTDDEI